MYAALYGQCRAGAQIIFPESWCGLGHVTPTILAVRSAILAAAWLLVFFSFLLVRRALLPRFKPLISGAAFSVAPFNINNGVKHHGVLSPVLSCVHVDEVLIALSAAGVGSLIGTF